MDHIVAVDNTLGNVKQALQAQGYKVSDLEQGLQNASVVVISGMKDNVFGDQRAQTKARVIDAAGLTAEQVLDEVDKALKVRYEQ